MIETVDLQVEARDQDIVVTMPGTSLRVVYRKPHRGSQLVARLDYFQDQQKGPVKRAEFIAKALKLANNKAREQGGLCKRYSAPPSAAPTPNRRGHQQKGDDNQYGVHVLPSKRPV
jgi:hypothetical protein